jgi:hypothetical protein
VTATTTGNGHTATNKQILVPDFRRGELNVRIRGVSPLLTNRPGPLTLQGITEGQGPKPLVKVQRAPRDPRAEFEDHIHRDGEGRCCFPASGVKQAMITANQRYVAEKQATMLKGAVIIVGYLLPIESPNPPTMGVDWVRLQGVNRPLSIAYRPVFWPWEIALKIKFNASAIDADRILKMLRAAGEMVGIGAWRVECDGDMGRFGLVEGDVEVRYLG